MRVWTSLTYTLPVPTPRKNTIHTIHTIRTTNFKMTSPSSSGSPAVASKNLVTPLLERLFPTPVSFFARTNATSDDVVPLCLHCLMVEAGCSPRSSKDNRPPVSWNQHPDEWIIEYRHWNAASGTLRLHCSLQRRSGRLFVHAEELVDDPKLTKAQERKTDQDASARNIQVLGLQLTNYTRNVADDAGGSWSDYVRNERTLKEMFLQFIVRPLLEASGMRALEGLREEGRGMELYQEASVDVANDVMDLPDATAAAKDAAAKDAAIEDAAAKDAAIEDADDNAGDRRLPQKIQDPELFSPEPGYPHSSYSSYSSYSTYPSYVESYGGPPLYLGLAAAIGVACVVGGWWWTRRR